MNTWDALYIGGEWVAPATDDRLEILSPFDQSPVGSVPEASVADVEAAVGAARACMDGGALALASQDERAEWIDALAGGIGARAEQFARLISAEMGSPYIFSQLAQVGATLMNVSAMAGLARTFPVEEERDGVMGKCLVRREPVGVVGGVVAWNVPLFLACNKIVTALATGCPIVLKPSPETPLDAMLLAEVIDEIGLPQGAVSILPAGREVGAHLVGHPEVDKVTFTGSTAAGRAIGAMCGDQLKRCTLELGGKSAAIICDDADMSVVAPMLMMTGLMNNGQACVAQTRVLVPAAREAEINEALVEAIRGQVLGDPLDEATTVGPLVAERQRDRVEGYLAAGREAGANLAIGGGRPSDSALDAGWFIEPTLFTGVDNSMVIAREEIFGPVLCSIPYSSEDEAVKIANDSDYGLSGSVWTEDTERGIDIARRVRTGTYNVNTFALDPMAPFGGFKSSGVGREFGHEGFAACTEYKTINLG